MSAVIGPFGRDKCIRFSPAKKHFCFFSGSDGTIRLSYLVYFFELGTPFTGHDKSKIPTMYSHNKNNKLQGIDYANSTTISFLKFTRDGKYLISGGSDGTIGYRTVDPEELVKNCLKRAGRKLTAIEKK